MCPQTQPVRPSPSLPPPMDYTGIFSSYSVSHTLAPELIFNSNAIFDQKVDIFSLACLLYRLFTGQKLIHAESNEKTYKSDLKAAFPLKLADMIPSSLLRTCIHRLASTNSDCSISRANVAAKPCKPAYHSDFFGLRIF